MMDSNTSTSPGNSRHMGMFNCLIGRRLKLFLDINKIPPRRLASELQIPPAVIENLLMGKIDNDLSWLVLYYLIMMYGLDIHWLLEDLEKVPGFPPVDLHIDA